MELTLRDGRTLQVVASGGDGPALVFHHGTPGRAMDYRPWIHGASDAGFGWIATSRPGYGGSTPRPGRSVADDADDVTEVLDNLGIERFVAVGWSGGGPHAIACGARLAGRCAGVISLAGVAPYDAMSAAGLDWRAGMTPGNVEEYGLALQGEAPLRAALESWHDEVGTTTGEEIAALLGGVVDAPPEIAAQAGEFAAAVASSFREGVRSGIDGWLEDDLAFVRSWGFALADVAVPVAVWQGDDDRMVPYGHGRLLAELLPHVRPHLLSGENHLSIALGAFAEVLAEARSFAAGS
jgi:pimeloyl-ACP methyl ester carboxylesterase